MFQFMNQHAPRQQASQGISAEGPTLHAMLDAELLREMSRDEVNALPIQRYEGEVRLVANAQELERAVSAWRDERVAGFDTETRPAFRPGESYLPALAQIAVANAVYLLPLQRFDCSAALRALLEAPHTVKAGVGLPDDFRALRKSFEFAEKAMVDLGAVARRHGLKQSGVRYLAARFLGTRIPKGAKTSNWAAQRLSPQQIAYAATDAWVCRELCLKFEELGLT
jgi:ribonuclease D